MPDCNVWEMEAPQASRQHDVLFFNDRDRKQKKRNLRQRLDGMVNQHDHRAFGKRADSMDPVLLIPFYKAKKRIWRVVMVMVMVMLVTRHQLQPHHSLQRQQQRHRWAGDEENLTWTGLQQGHLQEEGLDVTTQSTIKLTYRNNTEHHHHTHT